MSVGEGDGTTRDDVLSQLARERREVAERKSAVPRPDFITNVEHAEIVYTMDPVAFPLAQVNAGALAAELATLFGCSREPVDYSPLLRTVPREQLLQMDESEIAERLVKTDQAVLKFTGGRFPLRNDFVPLKSIELNYESVLVRVAGVTGVAEAIAQDVVELVWRLAGAPKRWHDLEPMILMMGYATATRLRLPFPAELLVNPLVIRELDANLTSKKAFAAKMGAIKPGYTGLGRGGIVAASFFDDLAIQVSRFEPATGATFQCGIQFSITARNDYGTGRVRASTQMAYDDHVALLSELIRALKPTDS